MAHASSSEESRTTARAEYRMKRNVTEHTHGKISKSCIPCRFRHSKAGENATWGRTPTCNADSISTTLDFPDLTQFWNFN
eukprot:g71440.t1